MYAIIEIHGKQHRVETGQVIRTLRVAGEPGDTVQAGRLLATVDGDTVNVGKPALDGTVGLTIVRHARSPKIKIYKYRAKSHWSRRAGYRDDITYLRVADIKV